MNNSEVATLLQECRYELEAIKALLFGYGDQARPTPYLKKYAVIRATGSIEAGFKQIIADRVDRGSHLQLKNFIKRKSRDSSCNPRLDMIESMIGEFDDDWKARFNEKMALADKPTLKGALTELVIARNSFAHGGARELSIEKTIECFESACVVLRLLDEAIHEDAP
ncbi:HEPN domain-containing protein [Zoogloea sp.]|uniref:HEPN domain-containing protein n=1 Tax=Zoogloea sp. TaxID=49181 RepID=UPI00321F6206